MDYIMNEKSVKYRLRVLVARKVPLIVLTRLFLGGSYRLLGLLFSVFVPLGAS